MTGLALGVKVKVRYEDIYTYTLDVEVTAVCSPDEFVGRVEGICSNRAELTGSKLLALEGQEKTFKNDAIVLRQQG